MEHLKGKVKTANIGRTVFLECGKHILLTYVFKFCVHAFHDHLVQFLIMFSAPIKAQTEEEVLSGKPVRRFSYKQWNNYLMWMG